jgi:hypothetical protein
MGHAFARTRAFSKKSRDRASRARRVVGFDPTKARSHFTFYASYCEL